MKEMSDYRSLALQYEKCCCCYTGLQMLLHRAPDIVVTQGSRYCCYTGPQISFIFASYVFMFNALLTKVI